MNLRTLATAFFFISSIFLCTAQEVDEWSVDTGDAVTLHGESFGLMGGTDILYIHGGPSFPPLQLPTWLVEIGKTHRVHLFHQRGSGKSSRPLEKLPTSEHAARKLLLQNYSIERHVLDIREVSADQFGDRKVLVIGHSFGGYLATLYAAKNPKLVSKLVLLAPADVLDGVLDKQVFEVIKARIPREEHADYRTAMAKFLTPGSLAGATDKDMARRTDLFGWYFMRAIGIDFPNPASYPQMHWSGGLAVAGLMVDIVEQGDSRSVAQKIVCPTLIVMGGKDLTPLLPAEMYAAAITGSRMAMLENESHFFDAEPKVVAGTVLEFLLGKS